MARSLLYEGGPNTDVVRKRVLAAERAQGNGHSPVVAPPSSGEAVQLVAVPVQEAFPGRRCQVCPPGPRQALAIWTKLTDHGGRDFWCAQHKAAGAHDHVFMGQPS